VWITLSYRVNDAWWWNVATLDRSASAPEKGDVEPPMRPSMHDTECVLDIEEVGRGLDAVETDASSADSDKECGSGLRQRQRGRKAIMREETQNLTRNLIECRDQRSHVPSQLLVHGPTRSRGVAITSEGRAVGRRHASSRT